MKLKSIIANDLYIKKKLLKKLIYQLTNTFLKKRVVTKVFLNTKTANTMDIHDSNCFILFPFSKSRMNDV